MGRVWRATDTTLGRQVAIKIFVRPFPNVGGGRWQVSTAGGSRPAWARNEKELFYGAADRSIMAVPVQTSASFSYGNAVKLFERRTLATPPPPGHHPGARWVA